MTTLGDTDLDFAALSGAGRELVLSAAVQERFQPSQLMADWLTRHGTDSADAAVEEAMNLTLTLGSLTSGGTERPEGAELPLSLRREVLASAGLDQLVATLARRAPRSQAERSFAGLVAGEAPNLDAMGRGELLALASASSWAEGLKGVTQINPEEVSRRIADQDFVERVGGSDLSLFVGRQALLTTLMRFWTMKSRPTVLIEGPGGIGKSIAVARFFQMLLTDDDAAMRPDAILHFDFDLPNMQRATAVDMSIEIVRQLALRWSPTSDHQLLGMLRALGDPGSHGTDSSRISLAPHLEAMVISLVPREILAEPLDYFRRIRNHGKRPLRLILFADSFERAELVDEVVSYNVARVVDDLRVAGADVMVIYAARAYLKPGLVTEGARRANLRVSRFGQAESVDYLIGKANQRGFVLTRKVAAEANTVIKGWPLGLRIAVSMLGNAPDSFDPEDWLAQIGKGGRSVQATLYERLLDRISDEALRKLAKPGLLVRRITPEVIRHVLAKPCDLPADLDTAQLMEMAEREGQLFWRDTADPGALWHRQDLREIMLPLLRIDVPSEVVRAIHDAAAYYYASQTGDIARAEELYHRLCRGDPRDEIGARWSASAGQRLVGALGELPGDAAATVRLYLGGGRSDVTGAGDEELRAVAQNMLSDGVSDLSGLFAQAGAPESLHGSLGDIYAQSLARQGRFDELLAEADSIFATRKVPSLVKARIAITAAGVAEGQGDLDRALMFWRLAHRLRDGLKPLERNSIRIALARLSRKMRRGNRGRASQLAAVCDQLRAELSLLRWPRVAALETVAEVSEVLQPVLTWQKRLNPWVDSILLNMFRRLNPMFPSAIESRERLDELASILGIPSADVHRPSDLDSLMHKYFNSPERDFHARAFAALRSEVDAAYAASVARPAADQPKPGTTPRLTY
jgi:hypothetical protein